jgi:class 3 adenylate cyclase
MLVSMATWPVALAVAKLVIPEHFNHICITVLVVMYPYLAFGTYATYRDAFAGYFEWIGAGGNALAGLLVIYVASFFPNGAYVALLMVGYIIFFGTYLQRMRLGTAVVTASSYFIGYHVYLMFFADTAPSERIVLMAIMWSYAALAVCAGYFTERTQRTIFEQGLAVETERERSDQLLLRVFPGSIAARLKGGEHPIADGLADVTILFADIVGFTPMSEQLGPKKMVDVLNDLFLKFDEIAERHGVEKIETIGDAYLAAGGAPSELDDHPDAVAAMALDMVQTAREVQIADGEYVRVRIGIHTGPVIGGVIGRKRLHYDVFGETVNVASRIESNSAPERILVSESTHKRIQRNFSTQPNDVLELKGHGPMRTWWLTA